MLNNLVRSGTFQSIFLSGGTDSISLFLCLSLVMMVFGPFFSAISIGFFTKEHTNKSAHYISCILLTISLFIACFISYDILILHNKFIHLTLFSWFNQDLFDANIAIYVDSLTAVMLIVVLGVSTLVHIYSIGYMHEDPHQPRFMSYLSLFTFFMLMLIVSDNFLQLFLGWEGVGLSSYLLIGFWYKKESANAAAVKAFIVNRVGDIGLALGIFGIFATFHSLEFAEIFPIVKDNLAKNIVFFNNSFNAIGVICLLLFIGCMGKSAQIGLHVWLPDAMEGPTPVSALIHAATMVTAGVFLVARCSPLFEYAPDVLMLITIIGAITSIFAATVALVQNDIKKIIAYSTCSQLGYMFFACGVSAYAAGVFHLFTHAFFKALLFLCAGSVIHAFHHEQDINKMGGVWKKIPATYILMFIGSLALAGIPPFAGFYSKDVILEAAYAKGTDFGYFAYYIGIIVAGLTAFYSWRLIIIVFHGKSTLNDAHLSEIHESPASMIFPLILLSIGAIFGGIFGKDIGFVSMNTEFWNGSLLVLEGNDSIEASHEIENIFKILPTIAGVVGIFMAYMIYMYKISILSKLRNISPNFKNILEHKYYFDECYAKIVEGYALLSDWAGKVFDVKLIDSVPNNIAFITKIFSNIIINFHNGNVSRYIFAILLGMLFSFYLVHY